MTTVTANGNTYSDDGSTPKDMNDGGFREHFIPMVSDALVETAGKVAAATASAALAAAAASTATSAPGTNGSSTTSLAVGYGSKSLITQPGKAWVPGMAMQIASAAAPTTVYMHGIIASYNASTGALVLAVDALAGLAAVAADWIISSSAPGGAQLGFNQFTGSQFFASGVFEGFVDMGASNTANLGAGTFLKKTVTGAWALAITGIPVGASACFIISLVNAGAFPLTLPAGTVFSGGVSPALTVSGKDRLGFVKEAGGVWELYVLGKDVK